MSRFAHSLINPVQALPWPSGVLNIEGGVVPVRNFNLKKSTQENTHIIAIEIMMQNIEGSPWQVQDIKERKSDFSKCAYI